MARSPIIIPGQVLPGRQIFIPKSAEPKFQCAVPTGPGALCGKPFYEDEAEAFARHVTACAKQHEHEIHEESPRKKMPAIYDPDVWDAEYEAHMRRVGKRMLAEGRDEILPHER